MKMWCLTLDPVTAGQAREEILVKAASPWQALETARKKGIDISRVTELRVMYGRPL